jgi:septum site-determining protein MinC
VAGGIFWLWFLTSMVHAGVFGDDAALIAAYRLSPTQLRIATHITRPPDGTGRGGRLLVELSRTGRIRGEKFV